ncbi:zinc-binding dehydrogenase [Candidatus Persebacteraceae bacterium Df01]|uniref:Zinc-binding dehydrogenase n=1 Tax=Candidatus Doriopsillibacter californiensis TaxID=2970740 RepID=A0ABT7QJG1_9GAMM|nr:zinc-binding dehydrogenase [Candidatus Persebacteraceae bacterium Df01]
MSKITIQAAVCRQFGSPLSIETLTLAPPTAREVRVNLAACAICHSDIIYADGGWGGTPPIVFGHEAAGTVVEAGADSGIAVGTRVVVTLLRSCGGCIPCQHGAPTLCEDNFDPLTRLYDINGKPVAIGLKTGAFAEQVVVDSSQVATIHNTLPFTEACLLACGVLTGWGAVVNTANVPPGASVAVVGCGGVGVNCLQAASIAGASPLVAIDLSAEKLKSAEQFGTTHTILANADDYGEQAQHITGGRGFDYVFMTAGSAKAAEQAASLLATMGTLVLTGMPPDGDLARINIADVAQGQRRFLGSKMGNSHLRTDIPKFLRLHSEGRLKLKELIASYYPLVDINRAMDASRRGDALRNIILFDNS